MVPELKEIRLSRGRWSFDERLQLGDPGGFGSVYSGWDAHGDEVAVKLLHVHGSGPVHRELMIANLLLDRSFTNVMPVLDVGYDPALRRHAVVMPRAEKSLQDEIDTVGPISETEAACILHQIALGLIEVKSLVHRDLKPANVLLEGGRWKVSDFGIARLVEAATSRHTLKNIRSKDFAAPEQWRMERSSHTTDVYALGCIAYALVSGRPPFTGTHDEVKYQHLHVTPEMPASLTPAFASLVRVMVRKEQSSRPNLDRVARRFEQLCRPPGHPHAEIEELAAAVDLLTARQSEREAADHRDANERDTRERMAAVGCQVLEEHRDDLYERVLDHAPTTKVKLLGSSIGGERYLDWKAIGVGQAELSIRIEHPFLERRGLARLGDGSIELPDGWDVLALAVVTVTQAAPEAAVCQRVLVYRAEDAGDCRWHQHWLVPEGAARSPERRWRLSLESHPIDDEDFDTFSSCWLWLLAAAIRGRLLPACKEVGSTLPTAEPGMSSR